MDYREWTCEECTNGLVQIATIFVQQEYIDDIISFLQVVMMTITIMMMMMIHFLFVNHAHPRYPAGCDLHEGAWDDDYESDDDDDEGADDGGDGDKEKGFD